MADRRGNPGRRTAGLFPRLTAASGPFAPGCGSSRTPRRSGLPAEPVPESVARFEWPNAVNCRSSGTSKPLPENWPLQFVPECAAPASFRNLTLEWWQTRTLIFSPCRAGATTSGSVRLRTSGRDGVNVKSPEAPDLMRTDAELSILVLFRNQIRKREPGELFLLLARCSGRSTGRKDILWQEPSGPY